VGYLDVHAMGTFEAELGIEEADMIINDAMEEIMSDLADAEAIVIDARFNQGGYDTIGYAVASWFSTKTKVVSQKKAVFDGGWTALQDITINVNFHLPVTRRRRISPSCGRKFATSGRRQFGNVDALDRCVSQ